MQTREGRLLRRHIAQQVAAHLLAFENRRLARRRIAPTCNHACCSIGPERRTRQSHLECAGAKSVGERPEHGTAFQIPVPFGFTSPALHARHGEHDTRRRK
jgi:hypothetical protein